MVKHAYQFMVDSNLNLSKNFKVAEFFRSPTAENRGILNCPYTYGRLTEVVNNLKKVAQELEVIRAANGGVPLHITSGYRCDKLNEIVLGHQFSKHRDGLAADFTASDFDHLVETVEWLYSPDNKDVDCVIYKDRNFVHIELNKHYELKK